MSASSSVTRSPRSAEANPDTSFAIIDSVVDLPNVASLVFAENEGSFLVGAAAALKSQTGTIGFIGGVENDLIKKFEAGYVAGAQAVNPDIEVLANYISQPPDFSGFNDPAKGKEIAAAQYEAGADVVYSAAGGSGLGAFEAAAEAGAPGEVWAIGVDSDQYELVSPELQPYILTSMLKKVDVATYETIKARSTAARSPPASRSSTWRRTASATPPRVDSSTTSPPARRLQAQIICGRDRSPRSSLSRLNHEGHIC